MELVDVGERVERVTVRDRVAGHPEDGPWQTARPEQHAVSDRPRLVGPLQQRHDRKQRDVHPRIVASGRREVDGDGGDREWQPVRAIERASEPREGHPHQKECDGFAATRRRRLKMQAPHREGEAGPCGRLGAEVVTRERKDRDERQYAEDEADQTRRVVAIEQREGAADEVEVQRTVLRGSITERRDEMWSPGPVFGHLRAGNGVAVDVFIQRKDRQPQGEGEQQQPGETTRVRMHSPPGRRRWWRAARRRRHRARAQRRR